MRLEPERTLARTLSAPARVQSAFRPFENDASPRNPVTLMQLDAKPDGFRAFLLALRAEVIAFGRPVVYVHGDTHTFRIDKPLFDAQTASLSPRHRSAGSNLGKMRGLASRTGRRQAPPFSASNVQGRFLRCHAPGVTPTISLNTRAKLLSSANPLAIATSPTDPAPS